MMWLGGEVEVYKSRRKWKGFFQYRKGVFTDLQQILLKLYQVPDIMLSSEDTLGAYVPSPREVGMERGRTDFSDWSTNKCEMWQIYENEEQDTYSWGNQSRSLF